MNWQLVAALLVLGSATGFAAGLLGIGGGMLLVPFLTMLFTAQRVPAEHVVHMAIATSLATILFTSVSSVRAHHLRGAVMWRVARALAPGILIGSMLGAQFASRIPTAWIALLFALFVGFSATQMVFERKPRPSRELPRPAGLFGVGGAIGLASSLVGAGGAFISIPFMIWCNVKMQSAIATSAALGFPIAAAGTVGYILAGLNERGLPAGSLGFINLPALFSVAAASVLTAPLGARVAHTVDTRPLKWVFAMLLYLLAGYMLYKSFGTWS
jgi:uncharacterized membrane protein YfcA